MKTFKIFGKFQQNGRWSELKEDFIGYFSKEDNSDVFIGYMEEQFQSIDPIRYIKGLYIEKENKLLFLKMSNNPNMSPLMYKFTDINKDGLWAGYSILFRNFFPIGIAQGGAKITVEEVIEGPTEIEKKIKRTYNNLDVNSKINMSLIKDIEEYRMFLYI